MHISMCFYAKEYELHFIRGYIDGDGYISKITSRPNSITLGMCGTKLFLESTRSILSSYLDKTYGSIYEHGKI